MSDQQTAPELPPDADATFDQDSGRIRVDLGLAAGVPDDDDPRMVGHVAGNKRAAELRPPPPYYTGGTASEPPKIEQGPAPTGEEPLPEPELPPLVLDLNMNRVKMRELRACERILLAVYGVPYPVMPSLDTMPADLTIALIAHKLLLHDGIDASRMTEIGALELVEPIRAAFERAEEIDFASLGSRAPAEGEGAPPTDPTGAASGNGRGQSEKPGSTS